MQAQLSWALSLFQALLVLGLGLAWFLAVWQWLIGTSKRPAHVAAYESWLGVFAVVARSAFGFGLLTLVLVAIAWSSLFERASNVLGPVLLSVAVIAFLTKTTVFRIMVHERGRVNETVYSFCALGTALGYTGIVAGLVVLDAWLREPVGASFIDGRFQVLELRAIFFNPQVGLQSLLTALGAILASVGWVVGRQGLAARAGSTARSRLVPAALYRWLCGLGLVATLITLAVIDLTVTRLLLDHGSLTDLFNANLAAERVGLTTGMLMVATARTLLVLMLLYALLIVLAWLYGDATTNSHPLRRQLTAGLALLGPSLWACLWLLLYLSKGSEIVVGRLAPEDLLSTPSIAVLWVSAGLLAFASVAMLIRLWQSLSGSLKPRQLNTSPGALS